MNKTQLTKGLNKLGKIVKNNELDLRNISEEEICKIFAQAEDVTIEEEEIRFYLGEYNGRITKKDVIKEVSDVKKINGAYGLIVNVGIFRKTIEIVANVLVDCHTTQGYDEEVSIDVKKIVINRETEDKKEEVEITPEVTAMAIRRESESARKIVKVMEEDEKEEPTILDYGCGLGRNMLYIKEKTIKKYAHIHGTDTDNQIKNIEKSKNYKELNPTVGRLRIHDNKYLKQNKSKYDYILSSHVLNVVTDDIKEEILKDMHYHLADDGKIIIQVRTRSDVESALSKQKYGDGWLIKKGKYTTYQEGITQEKMATLLAGAGFKIEEHTYNSTTHMVVATK
jgi:2-polyprenyl-3-methyl-5-hydroxy-6-metoxy-1,4-benzoquinol methylase